MASGSSLWFGSVLNVTPLEPGRDGFEQCPPAYLLETTKACSAHNNQGYSPSQAWPELQKGFRPLSQPFSGEKQDQLLKIPG